MFGGQTGIPVQVSPSEWEEQPLRGGVTGFDLVVPTHIHDDHRGPFACKEQRRLAANPAARPSDQSDFTL